MAYIQGFVAAVPARNRDAYCKHAADAASLFKEFGATRIVEAWGDDVPDGKITDFRRAVKARDDEVIVFSWHEYPSKAAAEATYQKVMSDPRMKKIGASMPFDGQRMIFGGFITNIDERDAGTMGYVDGSLVPVPIDNKDAYSALTATQVAVIKEYGATRLVDAWGHDVPDGKVTDCKRAVNATHDETVNFTWIEWPSKKARDAGWEKVFADPRMHPDNVPYDSKRRINGGFFPILDI